MYRIFSNNNRIIKSIAFIKIVILTVGMAESNLCDFLPCLHGATCVAALNAYACQCADGYSGTNCQYGKSF